MDFFSKLGKKASKTYQVTKEKAANLSEELKLRGKINDLKDKVEEIYNDIGKIVYNEIKDGKEVSKEEVSVRCEQISKFKDEIEKIQTDILSLKKVRKCSNCGEELALEDSFCCKCGTKQPEIEKVEVKENISTEMKDAEIVEVANVNPDKVSNENAEVENVSDNENVEIENSSNENCEDNNDKENNNEENNN